MHRRCDALVAAARFVGDVYEAARQSDGAYVATVGTMNVAPGAINVIPGKAEFHLEIRFVERSGFEASNEKTQGFLRRIEQEYGVTTSSSPVSYTEAVKLDEEICRLLGQSAREAGVTHRTLPSWAGHDAQILAARFPTGMIFVPSIDGISHSPREASRWEDILVGTGVFNAALCKLAQD
jgi:acetylornithine deacetylase/succinyl-diaminopimelate desuccinylase-like protein